MTTAVAAATKTRQNNNSTTSPLSPNGSLISGRKSLVIGNGMNLAATPTTPNGPNNGLSDADLLLLESILSIFDAALLEITKLIEQQSLQRFRASSQYRQLLLDLREAGTINDEGLIREFGRESHISHAASVGHRKQSTSPRGANSVITNPSHHQHHHILHALHHAHGTPIHQPSPPLMHLMSSVNINNIHGMTNTPGGNGPSSVRNNAWSPPPLLSTPSLSPLPPSSPSARRQTLPPKFVVNRMKSSDPSSPTNRQQQRQQPQSPHPLSVSSEVTSIDIPNPPLTSPTNNPTSPKGAAPIIGRTISIPIPTTATTTTTIIKPLATTSIPLLSLPQIPSSSRSPMTPTPPPVAGIASPTTAMSQSRSPTGQHHHSSGGGGRATSPNPTGDGSSTPIGASLTTPLIEQASSSSATPSVSPSPDVIVKVTSF
jgi:hypothetical protein